MMKIGSYHLVRILGKGSIGIVFEGVHERLRGTAAIKILHGHCSENPEMVARLLNEARALSLVRHPGIVEVFDFGHSADGAPYIVMEHLPGETLRERLSGCARPRREDLLRLAQQVAAALAAAHAAGIVHRDIKPGNIMIVPDACVPGGERAKLIDFGIAKMPVKGDAPLATATADDLWATKVETRDGAILGTLAYMAPEQYGDAASASDRSDVYSLGILLYQMLSGEVPFVAERSSDVIAMKLCQAPRSLRALDPSIARDLAALVGQMIRKRPEERPPMDHVAEELLRFVSIRQSTGARRGVQFDLRIVLAAILGTLVTGGVAGHGSVRRAATTDPHPAVVGRAADHDGPSPVCSGRWRTLRPTPPLRLR